MQKETNKLRKEKRDKENRNWGTVYEDEGS